MRPRTAADRMPVGIVAFLYISFLLLWSLQTRAQTQVQSASQNPTDWVNKYWNAWWIAAPGHGGHDYGVYHFRKTFRLEGPATGTSADSFYIRVSADNRYRLFVNGHPVGSGPAQGTPLQWFYDTYNIAPWLHPGDNTIACQVWNYGEGGPWVQMSVRTALIIEGLTAKEKIVNTDPTWKVTDDKAYALLPNDPSKVPEFIIVAPGDSVDAREYPWGWEQPGFNDSKWQNARFFVRGAPYATGTDLWWQLAPRPVPYLIEDTLRLKTCRRARTSDSIPNEALATTATAFLQGAGKKDLLIPPHESVRLLFDNGSETTSFPLLSCSGGRNALLTLSYAEALKDRKTRIKGYRDSIEGKELYGVSDKFIADGGAHRSFRPLSFRSFRFLELDVTTGDEALTLHDLYTSYAHTPRNLTARYETSDPSLNRILETAWRTQDLCTKDYLLTDAYYEQLQYIGDNRIQGLILNSMGCDSALVKNMIQQYFMSRTSEGLTQSRYPCAIPQVIPTYSLLWISMLHDYWSYYKDDAFVRQMLQGVRSVLDWYETRLDTATGLLGKTEYFNFVDWTTQWAWDNANAIGGVPIGVEQGGSSITSMQLVYAMQDAETLLNYYGHHYEAARYKKIAAAIRHHVWQRCWDEQKQLLSDSPDKLIFSQHANIFGVLSNTIPPAKQKEVMRRVTADTNLIQCSLYFRFYLGRAYVKAGLADRYMSLLAPWKSMLAEGLTTFAEVPGNAARSDCHPWSCSPLYEYFATICGIHPTAPGLANITIEPELGDLQWIRATCYHQGQPLTLYLKKTGDKGLEGEITIPPSIKGMLVWQHKKCNLHTGKNLVNL